MKAPTCSPWGPVQNAAPIGEDGIFAVSTGSHGGLFVPTGLLWCIPAENRAYAKRWSGSEQWFEEDCAAAFVVLAFPTLFSAEQFESAERTARWIRQHQEERHGS